MTNFDKSKEILTAGYARLSAAYSRLIRGTLLLVWIFMLASVALESLTGSLVYQLYGYRDSYYEISSYWPTDNIRVLQSENTKSERKTCPSGRNALEKFKLYRRNVPPVEAVLDAVSPKWADALRTTDGQCSAEEVTSIYSTYNMLFAKVSERLKSVARGESTDITGEIIDETMLPSEFKVSGKTNKLGQIKLPPEVQSWMTNERNQLKESSKARELINTFLLLSALGAFGSLIFLIRDYISGAPEKKLSVYIFRPILGIFLAVAVFVLDILAHTVISTSSILQIRYEPLYILALGAGLMSETAYTAIRGRVDTAYHEYERQPHKKAKTAEVNE